MGILQEFWSEYLGHYAWYFNLGRDERTKVDIEARVRVPLLIQFVTGRTNKGGYRSPSAGTSGLKTFLLPSFLVHSWLKQCKQRIPPKKFLLKNTFQKFLQKISSKKIPKISKRFLKKDFENIQFPTSHLEVENPFGLVLCNIPTAGR